MRGPDSGGIYPSDFRQFRMIADCMRRGRGDEFPPSRLGNYQAAKSNYLGYHFPIKKPSHLNRLPIPDQLRERRATNGGAWKFDWGKNTCGKSTNSSNFATSASARWACFGVPSQACAIYGRKPYTFILGNDAFEIRLGEHIRPACHVQFLSEGLWLLGLDAAVGRLKAWFESLALRTTRPEIIARADWAFDYHLPEVDFIPDHFVTRATKQNEWREHRLLQSVQLGTGDTVVRIYDKVAEIDQQSGKAWLYGLWGRKSEVWRIEFQVRRDRLAEADIDTVSSLKRRLCQSCSPARNSGLDWSSRSPSLLIQRPALRTSFDRF